jgi:hypothetical protein
MRVIRAERTEHWGNAPIEDRWELMRTEAEITYNPKEKRFEVLLPDDMERTKRFFSTKRAAQRFVKRWEQKMNNPKPRKLKPSEVRRQKEKQIAKDEEQYFERLGV